MLEGKIKSATKEQLVKKRKFLSVFIIVFAIVFAIYCVLDIFIDNNIDVVTKHTIITGSFLIIIYVSRKIVLIKKELKSRVK